MQDANFYMCATKFFSSNFANENYKWIFKTHQNQVFTSYVWYSTTPSEVFKSFYFILNEKYGLFLKFWAPFQPSTTKSRPCSSLQSVQKIRISGTSEQFRWKSMKLWILKEISDWSWNASFYRMTTCDTALESFYPELYNQKKIFGKW